MRYVILIIFISQLLSQDIGQKMINNDDTDSAINYYKYLLEDEDLSIDDILYNIASIYSSIDSLKKAEEYFNIAIQDSFNPSSDLNYNRGNMLYKSGNLEESLKSYRDALLKNPLDNEARKNYEFVKNEIKKNKESQKKDQQESSNNEDDENNEKDQKKDQNQQENNKNDQSNNSNKNPEKNNSNDGPSNQDTSELNQKENNEDRQIQIDQNVENILNAMKENEKVNKKRKQNNYSNESGKEW